ncbi:MAG: GTP 3',8-cyclase MoaA [Elusimicrobia bacterium]|nr:GTP 3',8-cyclase MoaA [Elusimicrobiota bacterium]
MFDNLGRKLTHLRISITQRCNLDCFYCHHEGEKNSGKDMTLGKIIEIAKAMAKIGIKYVKITGGEPLLREDIVQIVYHLANLKVFKDISLTTNGLLLKDLAKPLKKAGLNRVNIGCDSISSSITKKNISHALLGIIAAKNAGLNPIKLNMVILKDINHHEVGEMIKFASKHNLILQLIELIGNNNFDYEKYYFPLKTIEEELKEKADRIQVRELQERKQYYISGGIVEIVSPSYKIFCKKCSKIRVTSDGRIKPCFMREDTIIFNGKSSIIEAIKKRGGI